MTFGEADATSFMHKAGSDEATTFAVLDRAIAAGVNFIDTADVYGQDGLSERVLGELARGARQSRQDRARDEVPLHDGRRREQERRVALSDRQVLRGLAAPAEDRSHRPLSDPHAGHHGARGRDAARARRSRPRRQGPLHRLLELRRVSAREQLVAVEDRAPVAVRHAAGAVLARRARHRARARAAVPRPRASASCRGRRSRRGFSRGKFERGKAPGGDTRLGLEAIG